MDEQYGPEHAKKRVDQLETALDTLHGGNDIFAIAVAGFVVATVLTLLGIALMGFSRFQMTFSILAVVFCSCSSFNLVEVSIGGNVDATAKTKAYDQVGLEVNDEQQEDEEYASFLLKGAEFGQGHTSYKLEVVVAFCLAVFCATCGVFVMPNITGQSEGPPLTPEKLALLMGALFMLVSSLNLASNLRDRFDADTWEDVYHDTEWDMSVFCTIRALELSRGSLERRRIFFFFALLVSILGAIYMLFAFNINHAHIGFMTPGLCFMLLAAWYLSSALDEHGPAHADKYFWPSLGVFLIALGLTIYGLATVLIPWQEKQALGVCMVFAVFSMYSLAQAWHKLSWTRGFQRQVAAYRVPYDKDGDDDED